MLPPAICARAAGAAVSRTAIARTNTLRMHFPPIVRRELANLDCPGTIQHSPGAGVKRRAERFQSFCEVQYGRLDVSHSRTRFRSRTSTAGGTTLRYLSQYG